ncbi:MAG: AmmeMemoRadiSam system radical SAM enzyme [Candidatus Omnitrophica bacterium]|nr:AmmeMemoRadiSam system radical SAM enzyme [Candidatus Omnitrophota bacterium]
MKEAILWESLQDARVKCRLCNHFCLIKEGGTGICGVRVNRKGKLFSLAYGNLIAQNADPIEKKPLFHFLPGTLSYSVASAGCNFSCPFCQNYSISQLSGEEIVPEITDAVTPEDVVSSALNSGCKSIAYTYTEPTVFFEFALETSKTARAAGLKNVFVTNGYMSREALEMISPYLDAANVDLKGGEVFYKKLCGAKRPPVIENIGLMRELGIWVEVTTLLIPEYNDSKEQVREIAKIIKNIDPAIPWHISRFFPVYKMSGHYPTPNGKIAAARDAGFKEGLRYVYTGNMPGDGGENTYCHSCKALLIRRFGYTISENHIKNGRCGSCGAEIDGVFE